jgi:hypothetical protein
VTGDMNTYGTVYMSTNSRGIAYGKIDASGDVQAGRPRSASTSQARTR